jgi:predicted CoA-binding protein
MKDILTATSSIAVVGLSPDPDKTSYQVAKYLKNAGYHIIPVNPGQEKILGENVYPCLKDIPERIDMVYIFQRSSAVMPFVKEALEIKPRVIWLPLGVANDEAEKLAEEDGITMIMDRCMKREHSRYYTSETSPTGF